MPKKVFITILCATIIAIHFLDVKTQSIFLAPFLHANIAHLAINIYALHSLLNSPALPAPLYISIPVAYTCAIIAFALSPVTAVGTSAIILALFGMAVACNTCKQNIIATTIILAFSFLPQIATTVHLISLSLAFLIIKLHKALF